MTALIHGELIKAVSTRTLFAYGVTALALAVVNVVIVTQFSVLDKVPDKQEALAGMPLLLLLLGIVGAAGEHRHRTAAPAALVARRDRGSLLVARAAAYGLAGLGVGAAAAAVSLAVGLPVLGGEPGRALRVGEVVAVIGGTLVAAGLSAVLGAAVGALVRNQVAGVVGTLLLSFMGTELLAAVDEDAVGLTPIGAALAVAGDPGGGTLSWGTSLLVLTLWTVPLLIAAVVAERRRDLA